MTKRTREVVQRELDRARGELAALQGYGAPTNSRPYHRQNTNGPKRSEVEAYWVKIEALERELAVSPEADEASCPMAENMSLKLLDAIGAEANARGCTLEEVLRDAIDQLIREQTQMARDGARPLNPGGEK